jgi:hypothetical protein
MYVPYAKAMNKKGLLISDQPDKKGGIPFAAKLGGLAAAGYMLGKKLGSL